MNNDFRHTIYEDKDIPIRKEILLIVQKMKLSENNINNKDNKKIKKAKNNKKKKKDNKIVLVGLFLLFTVIFISSCFKLVSWFNDNKNTNKNIEQVEEIVEVEEISSEDDAELINEPDNKESDYWYYITFPLIQVDFNELVKKNNDTVAWVQVNNTNVNYPVVQTNDNDYYLDHSYDKSTNEAGWVFMDYRNSNDLNNKNTIIYAHSRLDKTMFGSLSKALKPAWHQNKDNHIIKISTPYENSLWQIFSVYTIEAESYYITTDFNSDNEYVEFLNTVRDRSRYNFDVTLNESDSIITLSTCYSDTERTVVHAKKIKKSLRDS